jgi:prepilin-type N-terminal cleavage/methylation domain-containing protein
MLGNGAGTTLAFAPRMQPTHARGRRRRRTRSGFSLVEIVVAVAIIAMISAGVTVAVIGINNQQKIKLTRSNAELLRGAVKMWRIQDNDSAACPTIPMLIADGQIDRGRMAHRVRRTRRHGHVARPRPVTRHRGRYSRAAQLKSGWFGAGAVSLVRFGKHVDRRPRRRRRAEARRRRGGGSA